jgi:cytochrome c-type protein NapB
VKRDSSRQRDPWRPPEPASTLAARVVLIGSAVIAMLASVRAIQWSSEARAAGARSEAVAGIAPGPPIASEAGVFRTRVNMLTLAPDARRRPEAHPRTLATYRLLRSYPGAPPRVPHGLTATEFRTNRCNTCHERGGYSQRFGAYAPVNPHPELEACLQCHATNDRLVGVPFPEASPDDACRQCHTFAPSRFEEDGIDWTPGSWPARSGAVPGAPPIPHDQQMRANCLSCHMGPAAVAEIRVSHPERVNCRQCHLVPLSDGATYSRPAPLGAASPGVNR